MIITKVRLEEENPMTKLSFPPVSYPLQTVDLNVDSSAGYNGYILKAVAGLDPTELVQVVDGFDINGVPNIEDVPEKRQLVLKIGLQPTLSHTYSRLRDELYQFVSRTMLVKLMHDSLIVAQAVGYISRPEASHFTNRPEMLLTIECEKGEFNAPEAVDIPLALLDPSKVVIPYQEGTAPAGLEMQWTVTANHNDFAFFDHSHVRRQGGVQPSNRFEVTYPFLDNDIITLNTHPGERQVYVTRASVVTDLAGYLNAGAVWPKLYPGINAFEWNVAPGWMVWDYARYTPRFWGV